MRVKNTQGGELVVIGKGFVNIHLVDFPHRVDVFFKKKHSPPPCDPHHHKHGHDELEWKVRRGHRGHHYSSSLHIEWDVHEYREIVWLVYY